MAVNYKIFTKEIWTLFRATDKIQRFAIGETEKDLKFPKYGPGDGWIHHCVASLFQILLHVGSEKHFLMKLLIKVFRSP